MRITIKFGICVFVGLGFAQWAFAKALAKMADPIVGAEQPWCQADAWPLNRDLPLPKIVEQLEQFPGPQRIHVLQWGWGEVLTGNTQHMVAPLFAYLAGTEQDRNLRGYYQGLAFIAMNEVDLKSAMKIWPKRLPLAKVRMTLKEMCDLYQKTLDLKRDPQGVIKKPTPPKKARQ